MTNADKFILNSYINLIDGLADFLGESYGLCLYRFEAEQSELIVQRNNLNCGTSLSLAELLSFSSGSISELVKKKYIIQFFKNSEGKSFRAVTILIQGTSTRPIGFLRIIFDLDTPLSKLIPCITDFESEPHIHQPSLNQEYDIILDLVCQIRDEVNSDNSILPSLKNKEIIRRCKLKGIFQIKNSVANVAEILKISKNTVYLHLKSLEK